jgi:hypothetical protein
VFIQENTLRNEFQNVRPINVLEIRGNAIKMDILAFDPVVKKKTRKCLVLFMNSQMS